MFTALIAKLIYDVFLLSSEEIYIKIHRDCVEQQIAKDVEGSLNFPEIEMTSLRVASPSEKVETESLEPQQQNEWFAHNEKFLSYQSNAT